MSAGVQDFWDRALRALATADRLHTEDPDAAGSRAYYAAFYAVSALFFSEGQTFLKHRAVAAAVHRDLVSKGRWAPALGQTYSRLLELRFVGDYGQEKHVSSEQARQAGGYASEVLEAVSRLRPDLFAMP